MTALISITHVTRYSYDRPVAFGPHRLLVRPRDGHDMRVLEAHLSTNPSAELRWRFDVFGNSVAHAVFLQSSDSLEIRSDLLIKRYAAHLEHSALRSGPLLMPMQYRSDKQTDLSPYIPMQHPEEAPGLSQWLKGAFPERPGQVLNFL